MTSNLTAHVKVTCRVGKVTMRRGNKVCIFEERQERYVCERMWDLWVYERSHHMYASVCMCKYQIHQVNPYICHDLSHIYDI